MNLNNDSRTRISAELVLGRDVAGSTPSIALDTTWHTAEWVGSAVSTVEDGVTVWTQVARTTGYFAGPSATPAGATVLTLGRHITEARVSWPDGEVIAFHVGVVDVA